MTTFGIILLIVLAIVALAVVGAAFTIVQQANRYVVERLGAYHQTLSVGLHFIIPFIERITKKVSIK